MANYTIKSGDTLSKIATANNTTVANLQKLNPNIKDPNLIYAGANLALPDANPATTATPVNTKPTASAIPIDTAMSSVTPYTAPAVKDINYNTPTVSAPQGTETNADGTATKSGYQQLLDRIGNLDTEMANKGQVESNLQNATKLSEKTMAAQTAYNDYVTAQTSLNQKIESIYNQPGITREQAEQKVSEIRARGNANVANLAIVAQTTQGLVTAAEKTIQDKLDAQFQPLKDRRDALVSLAQLYQNDLSESDKFRLTQEAKKADEERSAVQDVSASLHQSMSQNGAPASAYDRIDSVVNDFVAGRITASEAQTKMYQAAGSYGATPNTDIVKLDNGQTVVIDKNTGTVIKNLGGASDGLQPGDNPQLYKGLSSSTATAVRGIVNKYSSEPTVQNFATIQEGYNFASSISDTTTNPADDQALIYSLAKTLDPGSVVREGEYQTAQKYSQSWVKAFGKSIEQAILGMGFLSEEARKNIKKTIQTKYLSSKVSYDNQYKEYAKQINNLTGRNDGTSFLRSYEAVKDVTDDDPLGLGIKKTNDNPIGI